MDGDINEAWVTEADVTMTGAVCYSRMLCLPPASSHKASGACLHLSQALSFVLTAQINPSSLSSLPRRHGPWKSLLPTSSSALASSEPVQVSFVLFLLR